MSRINTQKDKDGHQKETQREEKSLQNDNVSNKDLKDLFSCLIKKKEKLDKLLFARSTASEGKVDRLSQMNKSLQNHDRDRLAEMEKQHNEVIYPLVEKMDRLKDALKKKPPSSNNTTRGKVT